MDLVVQVSGQPKQPNPESLLKAIVKFISGKLSAGNSALGAGSSVCSIGSGGV